eukprot:NODE_3859_length_722_cov_2.138187_g3255_i0.p1 GENE.NODE_3859_length_722_cov_2.138187_g3255_i0~~NODE_3859_length_722_cov_2.138187_g3255_i0.p1  ORF type:complete len:180 (-),score=49.62 NODE_3859_length_722_cov_2.138187_g3255_i0:16-555(-)
MSVGKTSLIARFMYNSFDRQEHTIGIDFLSKTVSLDSRSVRLQLWDTAGQERYRALITSYIRESHAAVLVYDIADRGSFDSLDKWAEDVRDKCGDIVIMVVGNKSDLASRRVVTKEEGEAKAGRLRGLFSETSAKTGSAVQSTFTRLAAALPTSAAASHQFTLRGPGPAPPSKGWFSSC